LAWRIANLAGILPPGDGVLIKTGGTLSFETGTNGDLLQIIGGSIQFNSSVTGGVPIGSNIPYPSAAITSGWLLCNGGLYGRTALDPSPEPNLFSEIGTTYGSGDGITNFAVPDLRGMFVRGLDNGRGIDPLRVLGSQQGFGIESHNHTGTTGSESAHTHSFSGSTTTESASHTHFVANNDSGTGSAISSSNHIIRQSTSGSFEQYLLRGTATVASLGLTSPESTSHTHSISGTSSAGTAHLHTIQSEGITETRPVNVAMNWIIKT
jgi:microcystin-dependent protein